MSMDFNQAADLLKGKVALITGASKGIGKEIAYRYERAGADIAFTFSNFPANDRLGKLRIELLSNTLGVTRVASFAYPGGVIKTDGNAAWSGSTISIAHDENPIILEFSSYNEGITVFARYLGQFA